MPCALPNLPILTIVCRARGMMLAPSLAYVGACGNLEPCGFYIRAECFVRLPVSGHTHRLPFFMIISDHISTQGAPHADCLGIKDCNESWKYSISLPPLLTRPPAAICTRSRILITVSGVSYTRVHPRGQIKSNRRHNNNSTMCKSGAGFHHIPATADRCARKKEFLPGRQDRATAQGRPAAPRKHDWSPASATAMVHVPWRACSAGRPHCRRVLGSAARDAISVIDEANSIRVAVTENQRVRTASLCSHALSPRGTLSQSDSDMLSPPGPWRWIMGGFNPREKRPAVFLRHASSASSWGRFGPRGHHQLATRARRCRRGISMDEERTKAHCASPCDPGEDAGSEGPLQTLLNAQYTACSLSRESPPVRTTEDT
ncbi:hypothetical protein OH76DRAFT_865957 [Lentinus brumalis]|uniref:Uncharacterized protein n=1 Tax=Lentinus brumalis TaxID=2498619 RepID=A0A371DRH4_9APHY|nr:hypothetical protein OH76DRAFT_865957 [Polyporus brumalis]